jgi:RHS repeat-associated protein
MPVFNPPGGPPGPPVQFGPAQTNDSVDGGWGYQGTGTFEEDRYFYHHDHLGSSSYLTNQLGNITQHVEYIPFGEVFVEEKNDKWNTPYKFNGKELDEETGLYYYGARYLDSKMSLFLSVDPLVESTMDPYGYCYQNPLKFIDPTGMSGKNWVEGIDGMIYWRDDVNEENCQEVLEEGEKHLGESFSVGNLTYAADGKIYDDSEAGGGQPIANGRIQYIEEIEVQAKTYTPFYIGLSADAALIGGLGGSVGLVRDSYGRWGAYATFKGNIGLGAGVGLEGGAIKPEGRNIFKLEDFKGESSSYNIGVFGVGGSYGGTVGKNWKPTKKMDYRKWGNTQDGYTTKGGVFGETARPTLKNAKVSASVMYSYGITRVSSL